MLAAVEGGGGIWTQAIEWGIAMSSPYPADSVLHDLDIVSGDKLYKCLANCQRLSLPGVSPFYFAGSSPVLL